MMLRPLQAIEEENKERIGKPLLKAIKLRVVRLKLGIK